MYIRSFYHTKLAKAGHNDKLEIKCCQDCAVIKYAYSNSCYTGYQSLVVTYGEMGKYVIVKAGNILFCGEVEFWDKMFLKYGKNAKVVVMNHDEDQYRS